MSAAYLAKLSDVLRGHGVDKPVVVIDLDRLDANCAAALTAMDAGLGRRLVAKSLPCLPLLNYIRGIIPTTGLMTFSEPMLIALLTAEPEIDQLTGKPLPVSSAARVLSACPDASDRVQWLVDTPDRLRQYLELAQGIRSPLRLSLELDIGLHRGGFSPDQVKSIAQEISTHPYAKLSGLMGYEAHLAKLPGALKARAQRSSAADYRMAVEALPQAGSGLCLNTGGSLTFQNYRATDPASEVAFGSVLVKPSDFDHPSTQGFAPAAFIATPILKTMAGNALPGLEFLPRRKADLAVFGGHFLADPVFPSEFGYSSIFGRSSNQEVWTGPVRNLPQVGDVALMRPTQSEAVLNQFGTIVTMRGHQVVGEWQTLPN